MHDMPNNMHNMQNDNMQNNMQFNMQNMLAICRFGADCLVLTVICRICQIVCSICIICYVDFQYAQYAFPTLLVAARLTSESPYDQTFKTGRIQQNMTLRRGRNGCARKPRRSLGSGLRLDLKLPIVCSGLRTLSLASVQNLGR